MSVDLVSCARLAVAGEFMAAMLACRRLLGVDVATARSLVEWFRDTCRDQPESAEPAPPGLTPAQWKRVRYLAAAGERSQALRLLSSHLAVPLGELDPDLLSASAGRPTLSFGALAALCQRLQGATVDQGTQLLMDACGLDRASASTIFAALTGAARVREAPTSKDGPPGPSAQALLGLSVAGIAASDLIASPSTWLPPDPPTWNRQARERGIARIRLFYHKADGLSFVPTNLEFPVLIGGDYDGPRPYRADDALSLLEARVSAGDRDPQVLALLPFLRRLIGGEDFSLDQLASACRGTIEAR